MGRKTRLAGAVGAAAIALVGAWEGLRLTAYRDVVGIPTVCYGETLGVKIGGRHTKAECDSMLLASLKKHERGMRNCLTDPDAVPAKSYVAFVSLTYNIGIGAFCRSTARKRLNRGDVRGACDAGSLVQQGRGANDPGIGQPARGRAQALSGGPEMIALTGYGLEKPCRVFCACYCRRSGRLFSVAQGRQVERGQTGGFRICGRR